MFTVTVQTNPLRGLADRLKRLGQDATPVMEAVGTTLLSITQGTFNSAGAMYRPYQ